MVLVAKKQQLRLLLKSPEPSTPISFPFSLVPGSSPASNKQWPCSHDVTKTGKEPRSITAKLLPGQCTLSKQWPCSHDVTKTGKEPRNMTAKLLPGQCTLSKQWPCSLNERYCESEVTAWSDLVAPTSLVDIYFYHRPHRFGF